MQRIVNLLILVLDVAVSGCQEPGKGDDRQMNRQEAGQGRKRYRQELAVHFYC